MSASDPWVFPADDLNTGEGNAEAGLDSGGSVIKLETIPTVIEPHTSADEPGVE
jgi:hypothetical protein